MTVNYEIYRLEISCEYKPNLNKTCDNIAY